MMDGLISQLVLTGMHEHLKYGRVSENCIGTKQ